MTSVLSSLGSGMLVAVGGVQRVVGTRRLHAIWEAVVSWSLASVTMRREDRLMLEGEAAELWLCRVVLMQEEMLASLYSLHQPGYSHLVGRGE